MNRRLFNSHTQLIVPLLFSVVAAGYCAAAEYVVIASSSVGYVVVGASADGKTVLGYGRDSWNASNQNWRWTREEGRVGLDFRGNDASVDGSTIVGSSYDGTSNQAIRWTETGGAIVIAETSVASGVSGDGSVVVGTRNLYVANQSEEAFRWTEAEGLTTLGVLPGYDSSRANAVSDDGTIIVGQSLDHDCREISGCDVDAFTWTQADGLTKIDSFGRATRPFEISGDGTAVVGDVWNEDRNRDAEAFLWTKENGTLGLGHLPGRRRTSTATAVNFDGSVVVGYSGRFDAVNQGELRAFVWDNVHGMRDLQEVLETEHGINDLPRNALEAAQGISNDQMTVVGYTRHVSRGVERGETAWAIYLDKPLVKPLGDLNNDHYRDVEDIDLLSQKLRDSSTDAVYDLNTDGVVDAADRIHWIDEIANTYFGDANLDGQFNTSDLVAVFEAGQYEDGIVGNSVWATGDWDGDAEFSTADFVLAFQDGGYEQGPRSAVSAVPEPATGWLLAIGVILIARGFMRGRRE